MTFTNDPPVISSLELIPDSDEKADLDAPNTSGGKLVIGQAPNITITETTVVADAAERLALDVQEGDVAVQTNVSTSFIFTGGDNVANNWQALDFDAVGAIAGEDIAPRDITARVIDSSLDITAVNLEVSDSFNGANLSGAAAGEALTSDGSGNFTFSSVGGGDIISLVTATPETILPFIDIQEVMQEVTASTTAMQEVAASQTAMQEVAASTTAMQEVTASTTAMQEVIESPTAMQEVRQLPSADSVFHLSSLYAGTLDTFASINTNITGGIDDIVNSATAIEEVADSQTALEQVVASPFAFGEVANSVTAQNEIENNSNAINVLNNLSTSFTDSDSGTKQDIYKQVEPLTDLNGVWVKTATTTGDRPAHRRNVRGGTDLITTTEMFVFDVEHTGERTFDNFRSCTTSGEAYKPQP